MNDRNSMPPLSTPPDPYDVGNTQNNINDRINQYREDAINKKNAQKKKDSADAEKTKDAMAAALLYLKSLDDASLAKLDKILSKKFIGTERERAENTRIFRERLKNLSSDNVDDLMLRFYRDNLHLETFDNLMDVIAQRPLTTALAFEAWLESLLLTTGLVENVLASGTVIAASGAAESTTIAGAGVVAAVEAAPVTACVVAAVIVAAFAYTTYKGVKWYVSSETTYDKSLNGTLDDNVPDINFSDLIPKDIKDGYADLDGLLTGFLSYLHDPTSDVMPDLYLKNFSRMAQTGIDTPNGFIFPGGNTETNFGRQEILSLNGNTETRGTNQPIINNVSNVSNKASTIIDKAHTIISSNPAGAPTTKPTNDPTPMGSDQYSKKSNTELNFKPYSEIQNLNKKPIDSNTELNFNSNNNSIIKVNNNKNKNEINPAGFNDKKQTVVGTLGIPLKPSRNDAILEDLRPKAYSLGYDLGLLISQTSSYMAGSNQTYEQSLELIVKTQSHLAYLFEPVKTYLAYSEPLNISSYSEIERVYNGRSLNVSDVYVKRYTLANGTIKDNFAMLDEVGVEQEYFEGFGFIPSFAPDGDRWTGPASFNDRAATTLLSLFSFLHDTDYQHGFFDLTGDLKLISRISQNYDRMTSREIPYAKFTERYFSSIGYLMSSMTHKARINLQSPTDEVKAEPGIFDVLMRNNSDPNVRLEFYRGLNDGIQSGSIEFSNGMNVCHSMSEDVLSNLILVDL